MHGQQNIKIRRNKYSWCTNIRKNVSLCFLTKRKTLQLLQYCFLLQKNIKVGLLYHIARTFGAIQLDHSECRFTVVLLISQFCWFDRLWGKCATSEKYWILLHSSEAYECRAYCIRSNFMPEIWPVAKMHWNNNKKMKMRIYHLQQHASYISTITYKPIKNRYFQQKYHIGFKFYGTWSIHGDEYENCCNLKCGVMKFERRLPTLRMKLLSPT